MPIVTLDSQPVDAISHVDGLDTSMVLSLPLTEGGAEIAHNASLYGSVNDGIIHGATWGEIGLDFDGIDDHINCGSDPSLNITDAIAIEAWVKRIGELNGDVDSYYTIVAKGRTNADGSWSIFVDGTGEAYFGCRWDLGWNAIILGSLPTNTWFYLVGTYDHQYLKGYKNGVQTDTVSVSKDICETDKPTTIGGGVPSYLYFNGTIGEGEIYNRAPSVDEIVSSFEASRGKYGV